MSTRIRVTLGVLACVAIATCTVNPRNGTEVSSPSQTYTFNGYVLNPGATVSIQAWNYKTQSWTQRATAVSKTGSPSITDQCGEKWYAFSRSVALSSSGSFWNDIVGFGFQRSTYRVRQGSITTATFDQNVTTGTCPERCGIDVIVECSNVTSHIQFFCLNPNGCPRPSSPCADCAEPPLG